MSDKDPLSLVESKALEGERAQPNGACLPLYTPYSLFFLVFPFFLFSSFPFQCLLICCDSLLEVAITVFVIVMVILLSLCTVRVLYIVPAVTRFYYFSP